MRGSEMIALIGTTLLLLAACTGPRSRSSGPGGIQGSQVAVEAPRRIASPSSPSRRRTGSPRRTASRPVRQGVRR